MPRLPINANMSLYFVAASSPKVDTGLTPSINGFCIGFWVKVFDIRSNRTIFNSNSTGTGGVRMDYLLNSGSFKPWQYQYVKSGAAIVNMPGAGNGIAGAGTWFHYACTYTPNSFKTYVNGVLTNTDVSCVMDGSGVLWIGGFNGSSPSTFRITNFTFENTTTPWTLAQIQNLMYQKSLPNPTTLFYSFQNVATDQNGNNAMTLTNTPYCPDTPFGSRLLGVGTTEQSLSFNGTSDYATVPVTPNITGLSWGAWVWFSTKVLSRLLSWGTSATNDGFNNMFEGANGKWYTSVYNVAAVKFLDLPTQAPIGTWCHVVFTHVQGAQKTYFNGIQVDTDTGNMTAATGQPLTIGKKSWLASEYWGGKVKNFTFQNTTTPWTQSQINDLYFRDIIPSGAQQWSMNGTLNDTTGANPLTVNGTSYSADVPSQFKARALSGSRTKVTSPTRTLVT